MAGKTITGLLRGVFWGGVVAAFTVTLASQNLARRSLPGGEAPELSIRVPDAPQTPSLPKSQNDNRDMSDTATPQPRAPEMASAPDMAIDGGDPAGSVLARPTDPPSPVLPIEDKGTARPSVQVDAENIPPARQDDAPAPIGTGNDTGATTTPGDSDDTAVTVRPAARNAPSLPTPGRMAVQDGDAPEIFDTPSRLSPIPSTERMDAATLSRRGKVVPGALVPPVADVAVAGPTAGGATPDAMRRPPEAFGELSDDATFEPEVFAGSDDVAPVVGERARPSVLPTEAGSESAEFDTTPPAPPAAASPDIQDGAPEVGQVADVGDTPAALPDPDAAPLVAPAPFLRATDTGRGAGPRIARVNVGLPRIGASETLILQEPGAGNVGVIGGQGIGKPVVDRPDAPSVPGPADVAPPQVQEAPSLSADPDVVDVAPVEPPTPDPIGAGSDSVDTPDPLLFNGGPALRPDPETKARDSVGTVDAAADAIAPEEDAMVRNSEPFANVTGKPLIAVILLDTAGPVVNLPFPVSIALDTTRDDASGRAATYRATGKEVVTIQTSAIVRGADAASIEGRSDPFDVSVAMMNTDDGTSLGDGEGIATMVSRLSDTGHGFVSFVEDPTEGARLFERAGVPLGLVFRQIDADGQDARAVMRFLDEAAFRARQQNGLILVGQNRPETVAALAEWESGTRGAGVELAPLSAVLRLKAR